MISIITRALLLILIAVSVVYGGCLIGSSLDLDRVRNKLEPKYTYKKHLYFDGGSKKYDGVFYEIYILNILYTLNAIDGRYYGYILRYKLPFLQDTGRMFFTSDDSFPLGNSQIKDIPVDWVTAWPKPKKAEQGAAANP